ncbi:MAG: PASTA domain-containing protein, partial [Acidobacteriota bacterium]|nr:PASTA domain-containing protein [Acidobacteriota bacterium]
PSLVSMSSGSTGLMPDLRGLGAREALRVLGKLGLSARMQGSGVVILQHPEAGAPLERGGLSVLRLGRDVVTAPPAGDGQKPEARR